MVMSFPSSGNSGRPWARLDARTGIMFLSSPDGTKVPFDLKGKVLALNIAEAEQGWLHVSAAGVDWRPVHNNVWGDKPTPDHKAGVDLEIYCKDFGPESVRTSRGNSLGWTSFIGDVSNQAADLSGPAWPTIKVTAVKVIKYGQGSSVEIEFIMGPKDKWIAPPAQEADPAPKPAPKPATTVGELDDAEF